MVDDDRSVRTGLARLLRTAGYEVHVYESGDEFLAQVKDGVVGCAILDARMPGISVEKLAESIQSRDCHLQLIVLTADDDPATKKKAMRMNAAGFFRKPVDGTALMDAIDWAMRTDKREGKDEQTSVGSSSWRCHSGR